MSSPDDADRGEVQRGRALRAAQANRLSGKARREIDWPTQIANLRVMVDELDSGGQRHR